MLKNIHLNELIENNLKYLHGDAKSVLKIKELNTNSNFLISLTMQPVCGNFRLFKL